MAIRADVSAADLFFLGEDKMLIFAIFAADGATPLNVAGLTLKWELRINTSDAIPILAKSTTAGTITITGSYNANPNTNTQRVNVKIDDTDTDGLAPTTYQHALKRMDVDNETILAFGTITFLQAAAH